MDPLKDPVIIAELSRAWRESASNDPQNRHEEGGYIVQNSNLSYGVQRWPRGDQSRIQPPPLEANNCYNGKSVVATFHTHPNQPVDEHGREWEQGPSESECRWHRRRRLRGYVISRMLVYEIGVEASVSVAGKRDEVLLP